MRYRGFAVGVVALCLALLYAGCNSTTDLSIHLVRDLLPGEFDAGIDLASLEVGDEAIIALDDIVRYDAETHEFALTAEALARVAALQVPVSGLPFLVRVGGEPIYVGAFWTPISSMGFGGIVIMQPVGEMETLQFEMGYPSPAMYKGADPRGDQRIMDALRSANKLR